MVCHWDQKPHLFFLLPSGLLLPSFTVTFLLLPPASPASASTCTMIASKVHGETHLHRGALGQDGVGGDSLGHGGRAHQLPQLQHLGKGIHRRIFVEVWESFDSKGSTNLSIDGL